MEHPRVAEFRLARGDHVRIEGAFLQHRDDVGLARGTRRCGEIVPIVAGCVRKMERWFVHVRVADGNDEIRNETAVVHRQPHALVVDTCERAARVQRHGQQYESYCNAESACATCCKGWAGPEVAAP